MHKKHIKMDEDVKLKYMFSGRIPPQDSPLKFKAPQARVFKTRAPSPSGSPHVPSSCGPRPSSCGPRPSSCGSTAPLVVGPAPLVVGPHGQAHKVLVLEAGLALHLPVPGPEGVSQPLHLQGNTYGTERTEIINLF